MFELDLNTCKLNVHLSSYEGIFFSSNKHCYFDNILNLLERRLKKKNN